MTTMLERAARAVAGKFAVDYDKATDDQKESAADVARAVLASVREPDADMKESAGWSEYDAGCWAEGIDAILGENK